MTITKFGSVTFRSDEEHELWIDVSGFEFDDLTSISTAGEQIQLILTYLQNKLNEQYEASDNSGRTGEAGA